MRQLVPHQANKVELYKEPIPLFHRYQVESQFDAMHSPVVQLRSGGYIVINPTEALVAIDVNSGRSTKERNIEETALRTNIEAAEEVARQVRLRDLAGLIVIDFIDMEETRHQRQVEHKVKDAMRNDRARIQIGRISAFGPARDVAPAAAPQPARAFDRDLPALRRHRPHPLHRIGGAACAARHRGGRRAPPRRRDRGQRAAQRRALPAEPEAPHADARSRSATASTVSVEADDELHAADCEIERVRGQRGDRDRPAQELARASYDEVAGEARPPIDEADALDVREPAMAGDAGGERGEDEDGSRRRRRRRRRRPRRDGEGEGEGADRPQAAAGEDYPADEPAHDHGPNGAAADGHDDQGEEPREAPHDGPRDGEAVHADGERNGDGNRRRRGRRGGRRRRRENGDGAPGDHAPREHGHHDQGHHDQGHQDNGQREEYRAAEPNGGDSHEAPAHSEAAPAPAPLDHMPVDQMAGGHMPVERAPYDPGPPVNVEAAPPPPPCTAAAADRGFGAAARTASAAAGARHRGAAGEAQTRLVAALARRSVLFGAAAIAAAPGARADTFPNGPFRIIVPFGAGSATDQAARNVAEGLNRLFGVPAVVENKPGANGAIAAEVAAKAQPDGQTIFVCSNTAAASNVAMMKSLPYDPLKDFQPMTLIGRAPVFMMVNPKVEASTAREFVALCKRRPGKINFGSGSASTRISGELLKAKAGIDMVHVPYKSTPRRCRTRWPATCRCASPIR